MQDYDPTDRKQQTEKQQQKALLTQLERENEASSIRWLMSEKQGRQFVWARLEEAGVFRISFNTNSMMMAFTEGNRNAGLKLFTSVMELCPEGFLLMWKEQYDRTSTDD